MKKVFALCLLIALTACKKDMEANLPAPAEKSERAQPIGQTITKGEELNEEAIRPEQSQIVECFLAVPNLPPPLCSAPPLPVDPVVTLPKASPFSTTTLENQSFTIDASKGGTLAGKDGTKLAIPSNAFVDSNGKSVQGKVTVTLKEALSMTDIVLGGLITTSNGKILESGGMIYVEATADGEQLSIAPSKEIMVTVPTGKQLPGMRLFTGDVKENNTINWVNPKDIIATDEFEAIATGPARDTVIGFFSFDVMPPVKPVEYKGGGNDLIEVNIQYPQFLPELSFYKGVEWMLVDQKSYTEGDAEKDWVKVDIDRSRKKGIYVLTFTDAKKNKKRYEVTPVFEAENYETANAAYEKELAFYEKRKKERERGQKQRQVRQKTIEAAEEYAESYIFPIQKLGWVNCDRFYSEPGARQVIVHAILDNAPDNAYVYMVFTKRNICIPGYPNGEGAFVFDNGSGPMTVPLGEQVLIVAVGGSEGKQRFGMKKAAIAEELIVNVPLTETTSQQIRELLNANLKPKL